jgi:hypothetical protein
MKIILKVDFGWRAKIIIEITKEKRRGMAGAKPPAKAPAGRGLRPRPE